MPARSALLVLAVAAARDSRSPAWPPGIASRSPAWPSAAEPWSCRRRSVSSLRSACSRWRSKNAWSVQSTRRPGGAASAHADTPTGRPDRGLADARSAGCLCQRGVPGGELPDDVAVLLLAQRFAQRGKDGPSSGAGIFAGQAGALAYLPDEVVDLTGCAPFLHAAVPATATAPPASQEDLWPGAWPRLRSAASPSSTARVISADSSRDSIVSAATARTSSLASMAMAPFVGYGVSCVTGSGHHPGSPAIRAT